MSTFELFALAVGLSMDAFAVAICKGLSVKKLSPKHAIVTGLYFGGFQALMPLIGYFLGRYFKQLIVSVDHWIAFVLLGIIGFNMIKESMESAEKLDDSFSPKAMLPLSVATSIDALAVGVTFALMSVNIYSAVSFIGVITFSFSCVGVCIGRVFGAKFKSKAEAFGGIVLIVMGVKILFEHLGILG